MRGLLNTRLVFCVVLLPAIYLSASQQSSAPQAASAPPAARTTLTVTVNGHDHRPVTGLKAENFTVYEDSTRVPISEVASDDVPACIGILVDESGSMRHKLAAITSAVAEFVRAGNPASQVFVVLFNDDAYLDQDFTTDPAKIEKALKRADARGGTAFYDSLIATADHLAANKACNKRVVLAVTDGYDNESKKTREYAFHALQQSGNPLIYSIGVPDGNDTISAPGRQTLEFFARLSGGAAFFADSSGEIRKAAHKVLEDLSSQYRLSFAAPFKSGSTVRVMVNAPDHKDLATRVNSGGVPGVVARSKAINAASPAAASAPSPATAAARGSDCISGSVVDEDQKPLPGIHVEALPLFHPNPYSADSYPFSATDEQGNFKIPGLQSGRYRLFTKREVAAPLRVEPVYQAQDAPFILSSHECANVVVRFPTKFARLKIEVVDPATKARIADYGITLQHTGSFPFAIPHALADIPILVPAHMELRIYAWKDRYTRSRPLTITTADSEMLQQVIIELDLHTPLSASRGDAP